MEHVFYFDGTPKKITWSIYTGNSIVEQSREHVEIYMDKISSVQSKYIALHVGLFWGIGAFIIKNEDVVIIKIDEKYFKGFRAMRYIDKLESEFNAELKQWKKENK